MSHKAWFTLTILCLEVVNTHTLYVGKRSHNNNINPGANKLAEALKVIQTEKRMMAEEESNRPEGGEQFYQEQSNWGYPWGVKEKEEPREPVEDYYDAGDYADADTLAKLLYMYEQGYAEPENEVPESQEGAENMGKADTEDSKEKDKKNIDWTPKALGFEGLKHKRTDPEKVKPEEQESMAEEDKPTVGEAGDEANEVTEENMDKNSLTDQEVKELLSDAKDTEVKAISSQMKVENVNGKETVSAEEIVDLLKDDGNGNKKEFVIETKVPEQNSADKAALNKELLVEEVPPSTGTTVKHKRGSVDQIIGGGSGVQIRSSNIPYLADGLEDPVDEEELVNSDLAATVPSEADMLRECLMKYIELEDSENTALAEALNWATKAQYDQTDSYIPLQVQYLRNAVRDEKQLVELRRQCFGLAEEVSEELENEVEDPTALAKRGFDNFPASEETEESVNQEEPDNLFYNDAADEEAYTESPADDKLELSKEQLAAFIEGELRNMLLRQGESAEDDLEDQEDPRDNGQWLDQSVDEDLGIQEDQPEVYMNPFLRSLVERYRDGKYNRPDNGMCLAVISTSDSCEIAAEAGLLLDQEAADLCDRHKLCYVCGAEHGISPTTCDKGFLGEAYGLCGDQANPGECVRQADVLFELLFENHVYETDTEPICQQQCALEYILKGNTERRRK